MIELKSSEWIRIKGRGFVALVESLPVMFYEKYYDPNQLIGQDVKINGEVFRVKATETYAINRTPEMPYMGSCGILIDSGYL